MDRCKLCDRTNDRAAVAQTLVNIRFGLVFQLRKEDEIEEEKEEEEGRRKK